LEPIFPIDNTDNTDNAEYQHVKSENHTDMTLTCTDKIENPERLIDNTDKNILYLFSNYQQDE